MKDTMIKNIRALLSEELEKLKIKPNEEVISKFITFMEIVLHYNKKINLTAITDEKDFVTKHFLDSIICSQWDMALNAREIIDVGTGVGFPGIPLAIIMNDKKFILVDSLRKRLTVLNEVIKKIDLNNVELIHSRAEDLAQNPSFRELFDLCVSRAVADLKVLVEICIPFLKLGAYMLAYKGPNPDTEVREAKNAIQTMGAYVEEIRRIEINKYQHSIVIIKKQNSTPSRYPRKAGKPFKMPIT